MKTTIDMARDALIVPFFLKATNDEHIVRLKDFEARVRDDEREEFQRWFDAVTAQHKQEILAEREACAKVCDELVPDMSRTANDASVWDVATFDCAIAIRNRGQA
jgi:hypothetical protein